MFSTDHGEADRKDRKDVPILGREVFRRTALPRLILWGETLLPPIQIATAAEQDHHHYDDQKDS
jgi:hypothetical protein